MRSTVDLSTREGGKRGKGAKEEARDAEKRGKVGKGKEKHILLFVEETGPRC